MLKICSVNLSLKFTFPALFHNVGILEVLINQWENFTKKTQRQLYSLRSKCTCFPLHKKHKAEIKQKLRNI